MAVPESVSYPRVAPHPLGSIGDTTRSSPHTPSSVTNELEVAELARSIEESFEEKSFKPQCKTDDCPSDEVCQPSPVEIYCARNSFLLPVQLVCIVHMWAKKIG